VEKLYVCGYAHCLHYGEKVSELNSVIVGKRRFHIDCANIKVIIDEIKDLYIEKINKHESAVKILGVINQMVFTKQIDPNFILFALKDLTDRKVTFKSPYSMHYFVKNNVLINKWRKINNLN
jgi:hypothetical protein